LISSTFIQNSSKPPKVTVLTGSPHKHGSTFLLIGEFIRGLEEQGTDIYRFDAAFRKVKPCNACDRCGLGAAPCVFRDEMRELTPHLLESDLIVFCTPLYYFGFSAQIKTVIDRFYAIDTPFNGGKRAALIAAAWNPRDWVYEGLKAHYRTLLRYMNWEDAGMLLANGCGTPEETRASDYPRQAYEMGRTIRIR
jgi:multimeric flavodoxin WrbA